MGNPRFEAMTAAELAGNFNELENPTPPKPIIFQEWLTIESMRNESDDLVKRVRDAISAADAKIAAIDKNLRGDIIAERAAVIRKDVEQSIEELVQRIYKISADLDEQTIFYSHRACAMRASHHTNEATAAAMHLSFLNRFSKLSTNSLKMFAELASATANLALTDNIYQELESREDLNDLDGRKPNRGTRDEIHKLLASVPSKSKDTLDHIYAASVNISEVKAMSSKSYRAINAITNGLMRQAVGA